MPAVSLQRLIPVNGFELSGLLNTLTRGYSKYCSGTARVWVRAPTNLTIVANLRHVLGFIQR